MNEGADPEYRVVKFKTTPRLGLKDSDANGSKLAQTGNEPTRFDLNAQKLRTISLALVFFQLDLVPLA